MNAELLLSEVDTIFQFSSFLFSQVPADMKICFLF